MTLKQTIRRILREESEIPHLVRRRLPIIKKLLDVVLGNSYPCDFSSVEHFTEGVLYDIETFLMTYELEGLTSNELKEFILEYLTDDINNYYFDSQEDC